ncbi:MAG: RDD family protein, partial [bacterium]
ADPGMAQMNAALGFSAALFILYFTLLTGEGGQTLGKMLLGIRVVAENGSRVGYGRSLLRAIAYIVSFFFGTFLGFLWALWDRKNQAWHDKIAGTIVVKV